MNFDLETTRRDLTRVRNASDFNTPAWHRCNNTMEQLENYPPDWIDYLEPDEVKEQRRNLNKSIGRSLTELSKLTAA